MYFVADNVRDIGLPLDGVFFRRDGVVCIVKRELCRWCHLEESRGCILSPVTVTSADGVFFSLPNCFPLRVRENARPIRDNGVFFSLPNCFSVESERENARPIRENALLSLKCCSSFVVILC